MENYRNVTLQPESVFLPQEQTIFRILDANCNRLREALRVIEEYYRFAVNEESAAITLKEERHRLISIEDAVGRHRLLAARNTGDDCFASENRPEELRRDGLASLLAANFKRAQEAARVLEEYGKLTNASAVSETAKRIRFSLYDLEQRQLAGRNHGEE